MNLEMQDKVLLEFLATAIVGSGTLSLLASVVASVRKSGDAETYILNCRRRQPTG